MNILFLSTIHIAPNRQRKKFDETKLVELRESIVRNGLMHPIVVRKDGDGYCLVAGERRMKAITEAHAFGETVRIGNYTAGVNRYPCIDIGELGEEAAYEAELEENTQRDDLTWQERAAATAKLMELRTIQARRMGAPAPTVATIAQEIHGRSEGGFHTDTRNEIILARHLDNPAVAKAKSPKEALKAIKHEESRKKNSELAATIGNTFSSADHRLYSGDCLSVLETFPPEQFDCLLTDPPYGMGADSFGDSGGRLTSGHLYDDSYENWVTLMKDWVPAVTQVMKPQSHAYVFCDIERFYELRRLFQDEGWEVFRTPLIWINPKGMRAPWPDMGPQRKYQTFLFASRGKKPVLKIAPDVVTYPTDENIGHAAQKPVALLSDILGRTCRMGDAVLDCFGGSGSIFPAAHAAKIKATAIELDEAHYGLAAKRLGELT